MGRELVEKLLPVLDKITWSPTTEVTEHGSRAFEIGVDTLLGYQGNPKDLSDALRAFQGADSQAYGYAGAAYTLLVASREQDGSYAPEGLDKVMVWLEKAQALAPDIPKVNVIEAYVYIYNGRLDDARLVLDYLQSQDPHNYYIHAAEVDYWTQKEDIEQVAEWVERAGKIARTVPERVRLRARLGDIYYEQGVLDKALEIYREGIHFDQKDYMLWHKVSIIYWKQDNLQEAERANQAALRLRDLPAARQLEAAIKKKKSESTGGFGRLLGR